MAEKLVDVKPVIVTYTCDACGVGDMKPTGVVLSTRPPQYPHECDNPECHATKAFGQNYPNIRYVDV